MTMERRVDRIIQLVEERTSATTAGEITSCRCEELITAEIQGAMQEACQKCPGVTFIATHGDAAISLNVGEIDSKWVEAHMKKWLSETTHEERQMQIEAAGAELSPEMRELMNLPDEPEGEK